MNHGMQRDANLCWFHGKLSRTAAEKILKDVENPEDGLFLVRESSTAAGDYVLSVLRNNEVIHYQIRRHGEDAFFSIDEITITHGLETLIEYYQHGSGDVFLTTPVIKDLPPHDSRRHGPTNLLHRATKEGNYTVVSELLKCRYRSLDAKNQEGQTAVHVASYLGKDYILEKLIESQAHVNCRDTAGFTPLHYACQYNRPSTVRILVTMGQANIQSRHTETGEVPLHIAAKLGHTEVVTVLLSLNAPANPRTKDNETPADLAQANGHTSCAKLLREYMPSVPRTKRDSWYHGTLDRQEAEQLLQNCTEQDGAYLVRYSKRRKEEVLTIYHQNKLYHYQIRCNESGYYYIDSGPYHNTLEHVIEYYSMMSDGLPTTLQFPVPPKPKPKPPEIPPNGLFSTLPLRHTKRRREESHNVTLNRGGMSSNFQDPPELGIPTVPLSALLSNQRSTSKLIPSSSLVMSSPVSSSILLPNMNNLSSNGNNNDMYSTTSPIKDDNRQECIPPEQLVLGQAIGEGEFGTVFKGVFIDPSGLNIAVAIKTLRHRHVEKDRDEFLREARVMIGLNHPCIVRLIGISYGSPLKMVQELVSLGSMLSYLLDHPDRVNPNYDLRLWASQIACGMKYLEEQRFVHRDLAARNILLASRHQAKISDFGLSRPFRDEKEYYTATKGGRWPIKWYAPESFNFGTFSNASDVWSFGVTLWEMFSYGQQPYGDMKGIDVTELVERGERLSKPEQCPDDVYCIMEQCWAYQPRDRPSFLHLAEKFASDPNYINIKELVLDSNVSLS